MRKILDRLIKFISGKGVTKFFAREFLILLLGIVILLILDHYYIRIIQNKPWVFPLLLLYGTRIIYLFFRLVLLSFRLVFFDKEKSHFNESKISIVLVFLVVLGLIVINYFENTSNFPELDLNKTQEEMLIDFNTGGINYAPENNYPLYTKRQIDLALEDNYPFFVSAGYTGSLNDFKELMETNFQAVRDAYQLSKKYEGYRGSFEDFKSLMGYSDIEYTEELKYQALWFFRGLYEDEGFEGSLEDFYNIMQRDYKALDILYVIAQENGYLRSKEEFGSLMTIDNY